MQKSNKALVLKKYKHDIFIYWRRFTCSIKILAFSDMIMQVVIYVAFKISLFIYSLIAYSSKNRIRSKLCFIDLLVFSLTELCLYLYDVC